MSIAFDGGQITDSQRDSPSARAIAQSTRQKYDRFGEEKFDRLMLVRRIDSTQRSGRRAPRTGV